MNVNFPGTSNTEKIFANTIKNTVTEIILKEIENI